MAAVRDFPAVLRTQMERWIYSPQVLYPNTVVVVESQEEKHKADPSVIRRRLGAGEKALPDNGTRLLQTPSLLV